jgi:hypothetical protein
MRGPLSADDVSRLKSEVRLVLSEILTLDREAEGLVKRELSN